MTLVRFPIFLGFSVLLHIAALGYAFYMQEHVFGALDAGEGGLERGLGLQVTIVDVAAPVSQTAESFEDSSEEITAEPLNEPSLESFDEQTVNVSQQETPLNAAASSYTTTGSSDTDQYGGQSGEVQNYLAMVMSELHKHKHYSRIAKRRGLEGVATLDFTIERDGRLSSLKVAKSSGYSLIDESAMKMFLSAAPFPGFPADMQEERIQKSWPIEFALQ